MERSHAFSTLLFRLFEKIGSDNLLLESLIVWKTHMRLSVVFRAYCTESGCLGATVYELSAILLMSISY